MFTNLANLLLGAAAPVAPEEEASCSAAAEEQDCGELSVQEAEDDWLLVDNELQRGALMASMAVAPLTPLARSRSHSVSSLPTLEESWFVTPPPCFTSTGPIELETSPLENLLIEHPSMSVYQRPAPHAPAPAPRSASLSPPPRARQPLAAVNPRPPRAPCVTLAKQQQQQHAAVQAAQKVNFNIERMEAAQLV
jgi:hypothetical protein